METIASGIDTELASFADAQVLYESIGEGASLFNNYTPERAYDKIAYDDCSLPDEESVDVVTEPSQPNFRDKYLELVNDIENLDIEMRDTRGSGTVDIKVLDKYDIDKGQGQDVVRLLRASLEELQKRPGFKMSMQDVDLTKDASYTSKQAYLEQCSIIIDNMKNSEMISRDVSREWDQHEANLSKFLDLEKRLSRLEETVGLNLISKHSDRSNNPLANKMFFQDIHKGISEMATRLMLLENTGLEFLSRRASALLVSLQNIQGQLNSPDPAKNSGVTEISPHQVAIVNEMYEVVTRWSTQGALLSAVIKRLETLRAVHARSSTLVQEINANQEAITLLEAKVTVLSKKAEEIHNIVEAKIIES